MPLAEPVAELVVALVELAVVVLALEVVLVGLVAVSVVLAAAPGLVVLAVVALVPLELVLEVALVGLVVEPVLGAAVQVLHLHTYSALFADASPHLAPDIVNRHSPPLRLDSSPSPPAPLRHPSFDCR